MSMHMSYGCRSCMSDASWTWLKCCRYIDMCIDTCIDMHTGMCINTCRNEIGSC